MTTAKTTAPAAASAASALKIPASPATPKAPAIFAALGRVNSEIDAIGKNSVNQQQRFKFRGIDDIYNALHPILARNGIIPVPDVIDMRREEKPTKSGGMLYFTLVTVRYTFVSTEDGSSVSATVVGEGMDSADKSTSKAMSIALKYALFQVFTIPTEEFKDPDSETPEATRPRTVNENIDIIIRDNAANTPLVIALEAIKAAADISSLKKVYTDHPAMQTNTSFTRCLTAKKDELNSRSRA